jgi:hypothetical protein
MAEASDVLRGELVAPLAATTPRLCDGLRAELARPHPEQPGRPLQFEADPWSWGITSTATEEPVLDGEGLERELPADWFERCEAAGVNGDALLADAMCSWFAECWQAVGGPERFSPAYLFLHGYHDRQYHLERRCWVPVEEAFVSLGGLAAAYTVMQHPDAFSSALCQSGSFWWLADNATSFPSTSARFWLSVGTQEIETGGPHPPTGLFQRVSQIEGVEAAARSFELRGGTVHYNRYSGGHAFPLGGKSSRRRCAGSSAAPDRRGVERSFRRVTRGTSP